VLLNRLSRHLCLFCCLQVLISIDIGVASIFFDCSLLNVAVTCSVVANEREALEENGEERKDAMAPQVVALIASHLSQIK